MKMERKRILVVESAASLCSLFSRWLRTLGVDVISASNGTQAMNRLMGKPIDGIVLDLDIPVTEGPTMLTQLRQRNADIPVIVTATVDATDSLLEALENGAQDYLTKPVSHHLFNQKCKRHFLNIRTPSHQPEASECEKVSLSV